AQRARRLLTAHAPQQLHRRGPGILLPREAGHESSATYLTFQLEMAAGAHDVAPGDRDLLSRDHSAEDDTVPIEEPPRGELGARAVGALHGGGGRRADQRPSSDRGRAGGASPRTFRGRLEQPP